MDLPTPVENCRHSDEQLFIRFRDSIVIGSHEDFVSLVSAYWDRLPSLCDEHGIRPIHLAVLYKRVNLVEVLLFATPSNVDSKSDLGLTPLHFALADKPKRIKFLSSYYQNISRHPRLKKDYDDILAIIEVLGSSGAKIIRSNHNYTVLSLSALFEMNWFIPKLTQNLNLTVSDLFDLFSIKSFNSDDRIKSDDIGRAFRHRLVFLIKQGLPVGYSQIPIDPSLNTLIEEVQTCFALKYSLKILNGASLKLLYLHRCIGLRNEGMFGEVAQRFILQSCQFVSLSKKYLRINYSDLSRALYLYIILTLESCLSPVLPFGGNTSWLFEDAWIFYSKLWNSIFDLLSYLWSCDRDSFEISILVPYMFQFFDFRLESSFSPNYIFASDMEVHARITFNFLCVYTILFLYLCKTFSNYLSSCDHTRFYNYLRILLDSSRSRAHLFNLLIRPVNYEHTFKKYNVSMEKSISFLLDFNLGLDNRSCLTGSTVLHEVVNCLASPLPVITFLLNVGAYPFSLDCAGKTFYNYLPPELRVEVLKHPSLKPPFTLQTLCCVCLIADGEQLDFYEILLPPHVFTFLKLHAKYEQLFF